MSALIKYSRKNLRKTPRAWWATPINGIDVLLDKKTAYTPSKYPIVTLTNTYFAIGKDGGSSWGCAGGIPQGLDDKLRGRQASLPKADLVCLEQDGKESYYVQFEDGTAQWCGTLNSYLQGFFMGSTKITAIALGSDDSYYCRNDQGVSISNNLPKGLSDALTGRKNALPPVENVNLGPTQEWFVRFTDGDWSCNGYTQSCGDTIDEIQEGGGKIHEIMFGHNSSWMVRYDP
jgi:hypothetical protein